MIHSLLSRRALLCLGALGSLTAITSTAALAQASYPSRPITLIVPFPPGGPADANGRLIARKLASSLGQPVVVDNKPGASGAIGAEAAARAAPDGYTLFAGTMGTHALNPALQGNLRYDPVKDFVPLHTTIATVNVLVVNAERPYKTLGEFVAFARQNPGRINYGSAGGPGTGNTLAAELFQQAAGVKLTSVGYKGNAPALTDLIGGTLDAMFSYPAETVQHVKDGKLRALAVGHTQRVDMLPGVPTMTEAGIANAELITWGGIFAPSGTPRAITQRLTTELARVMRDPEVVSSITEAGAIAYSVGGDDFAALVQRDLTRWSRLPKAGQ
jgi:tripartite-type tricarboxylate transporter receptor subunit TctC